MLQRQAGEVIIIGDLKVTGFGIGKYIWDRVCLSSATPEVRIIVC